MYFFVKYVYMWRYEEEEQKFTLLFDNMTGKYDVRPENWNMGHERKLPSHRVWKPERDASVCPEVMAEDHHPKNPLEDDSSHDRVQHLKYVIIFRDVDKTNNKMLPDEPLRICLAKYTMKMIICIQCSKMRKTTLIVR